jgi:hypothetical protein
MLNVDSCTTLLQSAVRHRTVAVAVAVAVHAKGRYTQRKQNG